MQIDSIKMQDLREKRQVREEEIKYVSEKRGKQTERRAGSFGRPRNSTRWKYISHRERLGYEARRSIRLYMKPGEAWAPPGGFVMQSTPPCGQFLGSYERL